MSLNHPQAEYQEATLLSDAEIGWRYDGNTQLAFLQELFSGV